VKKIWEDLAGWKKKGFITDLELEFAKFLNHINSDISEEVILAAVSCVHAQRQGNLCLDLGEWKQSTTYLFDEEETNYRINSDVLKKWIPALESCDLISKNGELQPLVLQNGRLYLHKYWKLEEEFCKWVNHKASIERPITEAVIHTLKAVTSPPKDLFDINLQDVAVILSFIKDLIFITGGPGTGKTYTVLNIIAAHALLHEEESFSIGLAAPTGKASRRLIESIQEGKSNLSEHIRSKVDLPENALTVHKLLGSDYWGRNFKYDQNNTLPYDLVIVDEASMLDINMWVRLTRAIAKDTKLVILGDKDQLASVEAGSILGDICQGDNTFSPNVIDALEQVQGTTLECTEEIPAVNDCIVFLKKSYRFSEKSGIQQLSNAINETDIESVLSILQSEDYPDVKWLTHSNDNIREIEKKFGIDHYKNYVKKDFYEMVKDIDDKKILCAIRKSPVGVEDVNDRIESGIKRTQARLQQDEWYHGRQVMATKNDSVTRIRNGEIGVFNENKGTILFEGEYHSEITPTRLLEYQPAFAITVHKSQGSEFNDVAIFLPSKMNSILSKEILYTSVTRARRSTLVIANEDILRKALQNSIQRNSGVKQKIWGFNET
jgi:exodeoxyribonuclease V alpha subunit